MATAAKIYIEMVHTCLCIYIILLYTHNNNNNNLMLPYNLELAVPYVGVIKRSMYKYQHLELWPEFVAVMLC